MSEQPNPDGGRPFRDEELDWVADHLDEMRRTVAENRIRYQILWAGLIIGLVVHVVGYLLKTAAIGEPVGVLTDLLYEFGDALWTGVVVAALVEIIPAAKQRQLNRALDAYEAALRARSGTGSRT
jgi:hypothetical protein